VLGHRPGARQRHLQPALRGNCGQRALQGPLRHHGGSPRSAGCPDLVIGQVSAGKGLWAGCQQRPASLLASHVALWWRPNPPLPCRPAAPSRRPPFCPPAGHLHRHRPVGQQGHGHLHRGRAPPRPPGQAVTAATARAPSPLPTPAKANKGGHLFPLNSRPSHARRSITTLALACSLQRRLCQLPALSKLHRLSPHGCLQPPPHCVPLATGNPRPAPLRRPTGRRTLRNNQKQEYGGAPSLSAAPTTTISARPLTTAGCSRPPCRAPRRAVRPPQTRPFITARTLRHHLHGQIICFANPFALHQAGLAALACASAPGQVPSVLRAQPLGGLLPECHMHPPCLAPSLAHHTAGDSPTRNWELTSPATPSPVTAHAHAARSGTASGSRCAALLARAATFQRPLWFARLSAPFPRALLRPVLKTTRPPSVAPIRAPSRQAS
jgi:hypothetical protein